MKAFVTGGTGFIGSHLVDALIHNNEYEEVRCLVRTNEKWLEGKNFKKYKGDLFDLEVLKKAVAGVDVVFHLAGLVKARSYDTLRRVNVDGTENLVRAARKANVPNIVVSSSLAAAGPSNGKPLTEQTPMEPVSMYGRSKKNMEEMIRDFADKTSSISILRLAAVYGPREDQIYSFFKMADKYICPIVGDGTHPKISMVYVDDVVQSCLKSAQQKQPGVETYFIASGTVYTWNKIRSVTNTVLGKKTLPIYIKPNWVKKIAGGIGKTSSFFGIYPVINKEKANELILEWTCNINKARNELGFDPQYSLEEGISRTIHWYKKHHWL